MTADTLTALAVASTLLAAALPARARAQENSPPAESPVAIALRVDEPPQLDGEVLSDPVWASAAPVSGFWQTSPIEGAPATERTEVRIVFTGAALYVGVVCFDRDPQGIIVADARRDSPLDDSDSFRFVLDTHHDRQNGFVFGTNPAGLEYDGQVANEGRGSGSGAGGGMQQGGSGGGFNLNWDGSWRVRTAVGPSGWSAEFEIPFRTLRYPASVDTWGVNFERRVRRRNETAYWAPLPRQFDLFRVSMAGTLQGLEIPAQRNLKIMPYVLGQARDETLNPSDPTLLGEPGVDLKYSLTPSLTLDATYRTDFAQVEVDEQQINLDRFNLFFPEKRPFFLENAGLFSVGSPGEVEVFFSRRIGIGPEGEQIPILGGGRLSGKVGAGFSVGLLNMQTSDVSGVAPANNFTVARVRQDLRNRSSLGAIFVNREPTGRQALDPGHNRTVAVDGQWGIGQSGMLSGFFARSATPGLDGDARAYQIAARRDTQAWELSAAYTDVGRSFNPEVGFLSRSGGFRKPEFLVFHRYRPRDFLRLQELRPHVSYRGFWKPDGSYESGHFHVDSHWEWKSGHEVHTGVNLTHEGVLEAFDIAGVRVPAGSYDHREAQIVAFTNEGASWGVRLRAVVGGFFGGRRVALTPEFRVRLSEAFNTSLTWVRNDLDLPAGRVATNLVRGRASYSFTPQTFVQTLVQYNDAADVWSTNIRFGWLHQANTGIFVVYNDTRYVDGILLPAPEDRLTTGRSLIVKVSRVFDLLR